ncbi:blue-light photoreceptor PHR2 [Tripterygium wilfordii]|uniref:Blue-light photoreceptor PHR2 n=1 Tax=Tripterygium wilfordii TaxID=458696 RepID=A0A7J7CFJ7_TRIWF|nr:blue-light photoreceptor PHR2 [Tripterygium wilfordii]KAF5732647.1 blue-light photoreceptor PHR2 [Tripterygium wilfordii]
MDSNLPISENTEAISTEDQNQDQKQNPLAIISSQSPFATASLSFSLPSTILPTQFFIQPKIYTLFPSSPNKVKVPTQAASLTHLSLTSSSPSPTKLSFKSTISANPLANPLSFGARSPLDPSNGAALRRASIVWFRNDLRTHDNECLNTANNESMSVLPVFCFDPRDYGKSSSGFDKTGPYRAQFLIESVTDLRKNLQGKGSDLVVRVGKPETVLVELIKAIGADAVYAHKEVSRDEIEAEEKIEAAMKDEGVDVKYFWGSTLYHLDDLPFKLEEMPTNHGSFKGKVQGLEIRKTIEALDQLKGMPSRGDVEPGEIPSLLDLGVQSNTKISQDGKPAAHNSMIGGETEALQRLKKFATECQPQPREGAKGGRVDSIYGASFSCKISPWLAMGCLSPRSVFDEIKKSTTRTFSAATKRNDGGNGSPGTGMNWLMFELLWRDFFRFITKKYASATKQVEAAPATACTGTLA